MPEPMAADSAIETRATSPESVGDQSNATSATEGGVAPESVVSKARPKRVRKLRLKSSVSPRITPDRPVLRLKASTPAAQAPGELFLPLASDPTLVGDETFELPSAPEPTQPAGLPAGSHQIEIPELRGSPYAEADEVHSEAPNGAGQDLTAPSPSSSAFTEQTSNASGPRPDDVAIEELNGSEAPVETPVGHAEPQAGSVASGTNEVAEAPPRTGESSEPSVIVQEHWRSPVPDDDPRFTYVPRQDSRSYPADEQVNSHSDVNESGSAKARSDKQVEIPADHVAVSRKVLRFDLRTQLLLIALLPIFVGAAVAFLVAIRSPTLYAARSEVVVNVATMDWSRAERFIATQLVVAKSRSTLGPIAEATKIPLRDLQKDVRVELVGSSDVIGIQYANSDAALALEVVKALTAQYLLDLRDYEQLGNGRHRLLTPATLLEEPVSLKPLYAALIGAVVGIAVGILGIILRTRAWRMQ